MEKLSFGDENPALNKGAVTSSALTDMMAQITKNFADAEENVIKEVLRQILFGLKLMVKNATGKMLQKMTAYHSMIFASGSKSGIPVRWQ